MTELAGIARRVAVRPPSLGGREYMRRRAPRSGGRSRSPSGASELSEARQGHSTATAVAAVPRCRSAALPPAVGRTRRQGPQRHRSLARARPRPQQPAPGSPAAQATAHMGTGGFGVLREHPRMRSTARVLLPGLLIVGGCIASACATSPHGEAAPCNGTRTIVKVRSSRTSGGASTSARCRFSCATRSQRATPSSW